MKKIKMGVIGLGQRGSCLIDTILAFDNVEIIAVCDAYEDRQKGAADKIEKGRGVRPLQYAEYRELLKNEEIEGVLVASSWDAHVKMAIDCMKAGKITAMEVGGAESLEECWELVHTYEETKTPIMMMENCCFDRFELISLALARAGTLGEVVQCHGAYSHDLRD
ncbi:MAG: Gfo/Idh/MocA family oxidoreductase, partial [Clostridia bacterium]|nr:Gfo/Idh/MocA family oxidoreductase [Clostridia bacterium]